ASDVDARARIDDAVERATVDELLRHFPDFERAYEPDGLRVDEFDSFGPSVRTLRAFIASYHELLHLLSDALLPNPDLKMTSTPSPTRPRRATCARTSTVFGQAA